VIYARISLDATGEERAVARQIEDCRRLITYRDWSEAREPLVDNSISASSGARRPAYEQLLELIDARATDVIVCWAIDRLTRRMIELEQLITRCEAAGVRIVTVSGDVDLASAHGRMVVRMLATVAQGEVEIKASRQRLAGAQRAQAGRPGSGRRPFGWAPDRITVDPVEGELIRRAYETILAGGALAAIAREWNAAGHHTPNRRNAKGHEGEPSPWTVFSLRRLLIHPRNAGLREYGGEIVGPAVWEPIVSEETWRAGRGKLEDPRRKHTHHSARRLLSGLGTCGVCGALLYSSTRGRGDKWMYRCKTPAAHVCRLGEPIDAYIGEVVVARLSQPDAVQLLRPSTSGVDVVALRADAAGLRELGDQLAEDRVDGKITRSQLTAGTARITARLAEVDAQIAEAGRLDVLAELVGAPDVTARWEALSTDRRRTVIGMIMMVRVHPAGFGVRRFYPSTVEVLPAR
jgi:DNA invertase Pin-like site-specific DNA recombinase